MPWIRFDCCILDDDFAIELTGDEFKAWSLFLLRTKALGARGRVKTASLSSLSRNWNVAQDAINSMLSKAGSRIVEQNGQWFISNWSKYNDDYRNTDKTPSPEISETPGDAEIPRLATTLHHTTVHTTPQPHDITPHEKHAMPASRFAQVENVDNRVDNVTDADFKLRTDSEGLQQLIQQVNKTITEENQYRTNGLFIWKPTTGSMESDVKNLVYKFTDDTKRRVLTETYNVLESYNWLALIVHCVKITARISNRKPIHEPYKFIYHLLKSPGDVISETVDGSLATHIQRQTHA